MDPLPSRANSAAARIVLGASAPIVALRREIAALAAGPLRGVLVVGETGTGKDLVARALVACSARPNRALEVFNCPAVPSDHLESELFGTRRGAYPGAVDRPGAVERAAGGVLVLDEIAAMPLAHQAKVLRLLENGEGRRLGATRGYRADLCIVAITHEDLVEACAAKCFREDLYFRLVQDAVLRVPPLRERLDDLGLLARRFLAELPAAPVLGVAALSELEGHAWPGNVRELRAVLRGAARLACMRGAPTIAAGDVAAAFERIGSYARGGPSSAAPPPATDFAAATRTLRRELLLDALARADGNRTRAGVLLGLHGAPGAPLDLRARKLAHRKFSYWWGKLVLGDSPPVPS